MVAIFQVKHLPDDFDDASAKNRYDLRKLPREYEIVLGSARLHGLVNVVLSACNFNIILTFQNIQIQKAIQQSALKGTKIRNVRIEQISYVGSIM